MGRDIPNAATASGAQSVPIPASVAETLAKAALENVERLRERGFPNTAQRTEECAILTLKVTSSAEGGEFVSLDGYTLGTITAQRRRGVPAAITSCARSYLEQYNVWDNPDDERVTF